MNQPGWISLVSVLLMMGAANVSAHEGSHGPELTDNGKLGGVMSPIIDAKDTKKGENAELVHKAELVRGDDGTIRIYLYDKAMSALDLSRFEKKAKATLSFKKNRKWTTAPFELRLEEGAFVGKAPKAGSKPFSIDVNLSEGGRKLFAAFDNLD